MVESSKPPVARAIVLVDDTRLLKDRRPAKVARTSGEALKLLAAASVTRTMSSGSTTISYSATQAGPSWITSSPSRRLAALLTSGVFTSIHPRSGPAGRWSATSKPPGITRREVSRGCQHVDPQSGTSDVISARSREGSPSWLIRAQPSSLGWTPIRRLFASFPGIKPRRTSSSSPHSPGRRPSANCASTGAHGSRSPTLHTSTRKARRSTRTG